jgi:excisionase family DNA binding protein
MSGDVGATIQSPRQIDPASQVAAGVLLSVTDRKDKEGVPGHHAAKAKTLPRVTPRSAATDGVPAAVLNALGDWVRALVRAELARPDQDEWLDQNRSPLGRRRHLALVREGKLPGHKDGKRVLVRRRDLDSYIEAQQVTMRLPRAVHERDEVDDELARLGFIDPPESGS